MVCIVLTACGGQKNIPTVFPSITPKSNLTSTVTLTATPVITETPTEILPTQLPPTPTFTPFPPYQNKRIIFSYYVIGNHSEYDDFYDQGSIVTKIVLYDDGQMIIAGKGETYKQKVLSSEEINWFLSKLETLGFYSLESNQKRDPIDKLYDYGDNYVESFDGTWDCILTEANKSRNLCVYESDVQFLIPKMKAILKYLDEYKPAGMTPYYPDRIFLVIRIVDPYRDTSLPTAIIWNEKFPSLETSNPKRYVDDTTAIMYVHGDIAKKIYLFFGDTNASKVFSQNGKEYIVYFAIVLPHEKIINAYQ
jgi:hypothetical protein